MKIILKKIVLTGFVVFFTVAATFSVAQFTPPVPQASDNAKESAPHDLTGYWVALVTEDWRFRMMTAKAGDYQGIPLSAVGQQVANAWDPAVDDAAGESCRAYGAGGIMRIPTRLKIDWLEDNILSIATDAGMQTRLLKFNDAQDGSGVGDWQGVSNAHWDLHSNGGFGDPVVTGTVEVHTSDMRPGYFRRNGVPYGEDATMVEYFEMVTEDNGEQYIIVTAVLEDPVNLTGSILTSTNFKREMDNDLWQPSPCNAY